MATEQAPWGRVGDDGTVYVREADGERAVGQYPDATPEEALAYYERKFAELAGQVGLLEQRVRGGAPAADVAKAARKRGLKPTLVDMADLDVADLAKIKRLVVIASTWGEGEPPARATRAYKELMGDSAPRLDGVEYSVLALGDTAYAQFCAIGQAIDERLTALGGKRVADRVDCDLDFAEPAARWIADALEKLSPPAADNRGRVIEVDFSAKPSAAGGLDIVEAEVTEHINLNSSRSGKETIPEAGRQLHAAKLSSPHDGATELGSDATLGCA